jgi:hypothetical protein
MTLFDIGFLVVFSALFANGLRWTVGDGLIRRNIAIGKSPTIRLTGGAAIAWGGFLTLLLVSTWVLMFFVVWRR